MDIDMKKYAKLASLGALAVAAGCVVVDNGSYWRMNPNVPLVVPEVNGDDLPKHKGIIANPNCSTIQLAVALKPIADLLGLKRIVVSTYQSISGAGQKGLDKLYSELKSDGIPAKGSPHPIAFNTIFHDIKDRSGLAAKHGLTTLAGVIDADYRGEVKVVLLNTSSETYEVQVGDRIAQAVFLPIPEFTLLEVDDLDSTIRGSGSFGSSGR
jgi:hypothetical protein